jgi:hypothetical protein
VGGGARTHVSTRSTLTADTDSTTMSAPEASSMLSAMDTPCSENDVPRKMMNERAIVNIAAGVTQTCTCIIIHMRAHTSRTSSLLVASRVREQRLQHERPARTT